MFSVKFSFLLFFHTSRRIFKDRILPIKSFLTDIVESWIMKEMQIPHGRDIRLLCHILMSFQSLLCPCRPYDWSKVSKLDNPSTMKTQMNIVLFCLCLWTDWAVGPVLTSFGILLLYHTFESRFYIRSVVR